MDYPIKKVLLGDLDINDVFFNSFKEDYPEYEEWFFRKKNDTVSVIMENNKIKALLKLKIENETEDYSNIIPDFKPKKRLKICSFKVSLSPQSGVGKTFLEMSLATARKNKLEEIYVTLYNKDGSKDSLISLLEKGGFVFWGYKNKEELIYVLKV